MILTEQFDDNKQGSYFKGAKVKEKMEFMKPNEIFSNQ